eukprot:scaffold7403_cov132-Skeletonema_menzelii.AAC.5
MNQQHHDNTADEAVDVEMGGVDSISPTDIPLKEEKTTSTQATSSDAGSKEEHQVESTPPSFFQFLLLAKPELPLLIFSFVLLILADVSNQILPIIIARAYNALVDQSLDQSERTYAINFTMMLVFILTLVGSTMGWFRLCIQGLAGERVVARLRLGMYKSVLSQDMSFFDETKSGEVVSRLGSDATLLQGSLSSGIPELLSGVVRAIICIILMFYLSAKLTGMTLGGVFVIFLLSFPLGKCLKTLSRLYQNTLGEAQTRSTEALGAPRTVQSFVAEEKELNRYAEKIGDPDKSTNWWPSPSASAVQTTYEIGFKKVMVNSSFYTLIFGGGFFFLYLSLWYGFHLVNNNELTIGDLTAFQSYVFQVSFSVGQVAGNLARVYEGIGASGRMLYLMNREPAIPSKREDDDVPLEEPEHLDGRIEFRNVSFAYPSRPNSEVLRDFSLVIPQNTTAALVGSSGAGKSTIVSLLQRFYDATSGTIMIDGHDITDLKLACLRHNIGYVEQEPQLFGLTVRENLLYGVTREVSQEELERVCRDANAHDFIDSWPDKYETFVGEKGVKVSGGQKQRLAIARALLTDCRILLLDEATSALDSESEALVQQAIDKAMQNRTVIIVAHRLSTVMQADQIVVMDKHQIEGTGTHEELIQSSKKYQDLIRRQSVMIKPVTGSFSKAN